MKSLRIDQPGGANFAANHVRNMGSLSIGASLLASIGTLDVTGSAYATNGFRAANDQGIQARNFGNTNWVDIAKVNTDNVVVLAGGNGALKIPYKVPPAAAAILDGTILVDSITNTLIYYSNGARYRLTGVAF